ncbi:hypothetical protein DASB73_012240 [Starmerella bacillaris]|uniref:Uncharacterized protein n=1 Tax=Starmerella bacillaris TaxID=1247836 RepID=A0AAV5RF99_STABA|nr:hypothetical protein DASB73_012240 [Starmerella bacillaris]
MVIPKDATVDQLISILNSEDYDPIATINDAVSDKLSLQEQHPASVELMTQLDSQSQDMIAYLQHILETLQKSERRIPHEIDLIRSDIRNFNENLSEILPGITQDAAEGSRSEVFSELARLNAIKSRIDDVSKLLVASTTSTKDPELLKKLAVVFKGTPEEAKRKQQAAGSGYSLFNKIRT